MLRTAFLALLITATANVGLGQEQISPEPATDPLSALVAEVTAPGTLVAPGQPLVLRFSLFNPTDETIEVVTTAPAEDSTAVMLPNSLIFGRSESPALWIGYRNERITAVRPPAAADEERVCVLRLAPRSVIGTEIDLTKFHRTLRYSGEYHLEWRPLNERIPTATIKFHIDKPKRVVLITDYGKVTFSLNYEQAPLNVANFLDLVRQRFYDGKPIHRIVPGMLIQGGSPDGSMTGIRPDGKFVSAEFNDTPVRIGTLAMARRGDDPDSASCQFFVALARLDRLDGQYTVIGQTVDEESERTLRQIAELPVDKQHRPIQPVTIRYLLAEDIPSDTATRRTTVAP